MSQLIPPLPLEVLLHIPKTPTTHSYVLCHPYGPMGGNFYNPVLQALNQRLNPSSMVTRFNFRGVGRSGGKTSVDAEGEESDLKTVVKWLEKEHGITSITLIGYSYGAMIAASVCHSLPIIQKIVLISYPFGALDRLTLYSGQLALQAAAKIKVPSLWICGDDDRFCKDWPNSLSALPNDSLRTVKTIIRGTHFWTGMEDELADMIVTWLAEPRL